MAAPFCKILVPVDFSSCSEHALEYAHDLAHALGATLDVVHVWESPAYAGAEHVLVHDEQGARVSVVELVRLAAMQELQAFRQRMEARGLAIAARLLEGDPSTVLAEQAKDYDLVVVGTHGRNAIARLFLGSVAERLVRTAPCPVLTVRESSPK